MGIDSHPRSTRPAWSDLDVGACSASTTDQVERNLGQRYVVTVGRQRCHTCLEFEGVGRAYCGESIDLIDQRCPHLGVSGRKGGRLLAER